MVSSTTFQPRAAPVSWSRRSPAGPPAVPPLSRRKPATAASPAIATIATIVTIATIAGWRWGREGNKGFGRKAGLEMRIVAEAPRGGPTPSCRSRGLAASLLHVIKGLPVVPGALRRILPACPDALAAPLLFEKERSDGTICRPLLFVIVQARSRLGGVDRPLWRRPQGARRQRPAAIRRTAAQRARRRDRAGGLLPPARRRQPSPAPVPGDQREPGRRLPRQSGRAGSPRSAAGGARPEARRRQCGSRRTCRGRRGWRAWLRWRGRPGRGRGLAERAVGPSRRARRTGGGPARQSRRAGGQQGAPAPVPGG